MMTANNRESGENVSKPVSFFGRLGLSLFFLVFFVMGSLFEVLILREFGRATGQRSWKKVACTIISSEVQEQSDSEEPYALAVRYRYEYGGQSYTSSGYKRNYSGSASYSGTQELTQKYPSGWKTCCYVNPADPGHAVLKRDSLAIGLVVLFPLVFVAVGAGGIYFLWKKPPPEAARPIAAAAIRGKQVKGKGKYGLAALFLIFTAVGGGLLYPLGIKPITRTIDARSWVETPCRVLQAEVRSHDSDDGTTYSVHILYQYECNGRTYKCDRYDFIGGSSSGYKGKARVVEQYRTAADPVCYVNPKNPSQAVLQRGFHAKLLLALFPLPFLLIGVGGLIRIIQGKKDTPASLQSSNAQASARAVDPLSLLRLADAAPAALKPQFSPRAKLVGAILIAAFWNGIVCVFLADAGWFTLIFLLPFIAIGVGLIALVIYQFLALFNPRPMLHVSSRSIPLGGSAELRWSFWGQTSRIREFTVTLRGVERARYRKGTSTCTDESTFYEMELYRTSNVAQIATGQIGFVLPRDTMHSFQAENNGIIWSIDLRGDIKSWPDVKESYEIEVTPMADGRHERHG